MDYSCKQMLTNFETNIKVHFVDYVVRSVNVVWRKKERVEEIKARPHLSALEKNGEISRLIATLNKIKGDIVSVDSSPLKSPLEFHAAINRAKSSILPSKSNFKKDSLP